ncbi:MAG TPA: hypothetical protein VEY67_07795 [Candidatus Dormibacteraeota bacterium]|nr:hypothetical protein [Candidatus Dormibacteraeota bacterium]
MRRLVLTAIAAAVGVVMIPYAAATSGPAADAAAVTPATIAITTAGLSPNPLGATVGEAIYWKDETATAMVISLGGASWTVASGEISSPAWVPTAAGTYSYTVSSAVRPSAKLHGSVVVASPPSPTPVPSTPKPSSAPKPTASPKPSPSPSPRPTALASASASPAGSVASSAGAEPSSSADASPSGAVAAVADAGAGIPDAILLVLIALLLVIVGALSAMLVQARRRPPAAPSSR